MKKIVLLVYTMMFTILFYVTANAGEKELKVYYNDVQIKCEATPRIINGITMVPLRSIFEAMGKGFKWLDDTKKIQFYGTASETITIQIGNNVVNKVGSPDDVLDAPPIIIEGRTFVPLRFITETVGKNVAYDETISSIYITERTNPSQAVEFDLDAQVNYGTNRRFLMPIDPPAANSIPISTRAQLEAISYNLSDNYHLTNNIDLSGAEWIPIGTPRKPFSGVFDGQGYTINNLYVLESSNRNDAGLFGHARNASFKNVGIYIDSQGVFASTTSRYEGNAGGLLGGASASAGAASSTMIANCYAIGDISSKVAAWGAGKAGGLIGGVSADSGASSTMTILYCYATGNVSSTVSGGGDLYAGGLIGGASSSSGGKVSITITNSYAACDIFPHRFSGSGSTYVSLLIGGATSGSGGTTQKTITDCHTGGQIYPSVAAQ